MNNYSSIQDVTDALSYAISHYAANSKTLFQELKSIHEGARNSNTPIVYPNSVTGNPNKKIQLTLLSETETIVPIKSPRQVDFNGWTIEITVSNQWNINNTVQTPYLFVLGENRESEELSVSGIRKSAIDAGCFTDISQLNSGTKLVFVKDSTPWTFRNETPNSYWSGGVFSTPWANWNENESKIRTDILLVKNGMAINRPIAPYDSMQSTPVVTYMNANEDQAYFKNLTFNRSASCCKVINLAFIGRLNNVIVQNIHVTTASTNSLTNDACLTMTKITNLTIQNYDINKTYSSVSNHGYGLSMNCIWNLIIKDSHATGPMWGVLGCNDLNYVRLENCSLNRFDIHCYGRDVTCINCLFQNDNYIANLPSSASGSSSINNNYNRLSSFYGTLSYHNCTFNGFYPLLTDYTYNVYSDYDIFIENCSMKIYLSETAFLFRMGFWAAPLNHRQKHIRKCWPNVFIDGLTISLRTDITTVYMFSLIDRETQNPAHPEAAIKEPIYYTSYLHVKNLRIQDMSGVAINNASLVEMNKSSTEIDYAQRVFRFVQGIEYEFTGSGVPRLVLTNADFA